MSTAELGYHVLEPLYADHIIHAAIRKPIVSNVLGELIARTLQRCPICDGSKYGSEREMPCSYCHGTGRFTVAGYGYFLHHKCDCHHGTPCDICRHSCHHRSVN